MTDKLFRLEVFESISNTNQSDKVDGKNLMSNQELQIYATMRNELKINMASRTKRDDFNGFISSLKDIMIIFDSKFDQIQHKNTILTEKINELTGIEKLDSKFQKEVHDNAKSELNKLMRVTSDKGKIYANFVLIYSYS